MKSLRVLQLPPKKIKPPKPAPAPVRHADLHAHTTASDGTMTPTELVLAAVKAKIHYLAITDHDTVAGVAEAIEAARGTGLKIVPGVELSAEAPPGKCHLLGLGIDHTNAELVQTLAEISDNRRQRNGQIVARLNALLKREYQLEEVEAIAPPGANVGRPHIADFLVKKGHVKDTRTAFDVYLGDGKPANVEKKTLDCAGCIELIHKAGGLCFVAHPGLLWLEKHETLETRVRALEELGMDGIEVYYPEHSAAQVGKLLRLADKYHLLVTGGSDYHGSNKPHIRLGRPNFGTSPLPIDRLPAVLIDSALPRQET